MFDTIFELLISNGFSIENQYQKLEKFNKYIIVLLDNNKTAKITYDVFNKDRKYTLLYFSQFREYLLSFISPHQRLLIINDSVQHNGIINTLIVSKNKLLFMKSHLKLIKTDNTYIDHKIDIKKHNDITQYNILNEEYKEEVITVIKDKVYNKGRLIATWIGIITNKNYNIKEIYEIEKDIRNCMFRKNISEIF